MGSPTEVYVDPSINANSGAGTLASPYGDLQYALNTVTRDATNGNRFNVKSGTSEVLSAALSLTTYGTPRPTAPLIIQGYVSAAGDGTVGTGVIDCNGFSLMAATQDHFVLRHLRLTNSTSANCAVIGTYSTIAECEVDGTTGYGIFLSGNNNFALNNYLHGVGNSGSYGILLNGNGQAAIGNYCETGGNTPIALIASVSGGCSILNNILYMGAVASDGIEAAYGDTVEGNSILSLGGTGHGITYAGSGRYWFSVINNLVEGFSGAGGAGIRTIPSNPFRVIGYNAVYNCTTAYDDSGGVIVDLGGNETLTSSPFAKSGSATLANRFSYFEPADTGSVWGGAYPSGCRRDKGAIQHYEPTAAEVATAVWSYAARSLTA